MSRLYFTDFPYFDSSKPGFVVLDPSNDPSSGKYTVDEYNKLKQNFKNLMPNQPVFHVSRHSLDMLMQGKRPFRFFLFPSFFYKFFPVKWLKPTEKVYALSFCICFKEKCRKEEGGFYLRIRSILTTSSDPVNVDVNGNKQVTVEVETDKIAYLDIYTAFENQSYGTNKDCLKFASGISAAKIDSDRESYNSDLRKLNGGSSLPIKFLSEKERENEKIGNGIITNDGSFLGIADFKAYLNLKSDLDIFEIRLTWDDIITKMGFTVKYNPEGVAPIPCPGPPGCRPI